MRTAHSLVSYQCELLRHPSVGRPRVNPENYDSPHQYQRKRNGGAVWLNLIAAIAPKNR